VYVREHRGSYPAHFKLLCCQLASDRLVSCSQFRISCVKQSNSKLYFLFLIAGAIWVGDGWVKTSISTRNLLNRWSCMLVVVKMRMDGKIIISYILLLCSIKIYIFWILKVLHVHRVDWLERCVSSDGIFVSVFCTDKNIMVKIAVFSSDVVLWSTKYMVIYPDLDPSLKIIVLRPMT
jgi:hypothetical protein